MGKKQNVLSGTKDGKTTQLHSMKYEKDYDSPYTTGPDYFKLYYTSLEFTLGGRHYFHLGNGFKIFVNAQAFYEAQLGSEIIYSTPSMKTKLQVATRFNLALGTGVKYKKLSLELNYVFPRNILSNYLYYEAEYRNISLIFGYTLF